MEFLTLPETFVKEQAGTGQVHVTNYHIVSIW